MKSQQKQTKTWLLRNQTLIITLLGLAGSVIGFLIINKEKVSDVFEKNPTIIYSTNEKFIENNAMVEIADINDKKIVKTSLKNLNKEIELNPGSYSTQIKIDTMVIWKENFQVSENEYRKVILPDFYNGSIRIKIDNRTPAVHPEEKIDVVISSSGNGYLWLYEISDGNQKLLFPSGTLNENEITADRIFNFPEDVNLYAGEKIKIEKYLFLVTSDNEQTYADNIASLILKNTISKGSVSKLENNWGAKEITVNVIPFDK